MVRVFLISSHVLHVEALRPAFSMAQQARQQQLQHGAATAREAATTATPCSSRVLSGSVRMCCMLKGSGKHGERRRLTATSQQLEGHNGTMDGIYLFFYYTCFGDFLLAHTVTEMRPRFRGRLAEVCPPTV